MSPGIIRFRLNGAPVEIADLPPTMTLLNWLRYERGLTGTKEGCAEGDCGACTVALREVQGDGIVTRPVCACILTIGMVHGKDVVTVEGISGPDGEPHPVQRTMSHGHASQCGFCTPGFVMSLWAAHESGGSADRAELNRILAGNLCRCTGYGPIIDAAVEALGQPTPPWAEDAAGVAAGIAGLETSGALTYAAEGRRFWSPVDVEEFAALVASHPDATILSGATDVGLWITKKAFDPEKIIHVGRVAELREIREDDGFVEIGAAVSYADAQARLAAHWPDLGALVHRIGGSQVRAAGTIGGNIANGSPIGDMPPALIALDATLVLRHGSARRTIVLEDFFIAYGEQDLAPGEFVEAVRVPLARGPSTLRCYKVSKRLDQDITAVLGCFVVDLHDGTVKATRLAYGGMAGTPMRAKRTEQALTGKPWTRETVEQALPALAEDFSPLSDMRASAEYRLQIAQNLLVKYYLETTAPETATRITEVGA